MKINLDGAIRVLKANGFECDELKASPASVPAGYALVPIDPTAEMLDAMYASRKTLPDDADLIEQFNALLAAAPTPPVSEDRKDAERYRWLRDQQIDLNAPHLGVLNSGIFIGKIPDNVVLSAEDADAAIDQAMQEDKP